MYPRTCIFAGRYVEAYYLEEVARFEQFKRLLYAPLSDSSVGQRVALRHFADHFVSYFLDGWRASDVLYAYLLCERFSLSRLAAVRQTVINRYGLDVESHLAQVAHFPTLRVDVDDLAASLEKLTINND